ncbi:MAG: hypothetical protein D3917_00365 [Candidatus Electrothrix sp. AX5]|nr:hypothetical protein [Candidatus Electrothrix sp. AX5]
MDKIRILQPGTWLIKAEYEEPYSDQKVCDVESFSATLTLVIQWAGLHTGPFFLTPPSFRSEDICPPTFLRNFLSARPLALSHSLPLKEVILTLCYAVRGKTEAHKKNRLTPPRDGYGFINFPLRQNERGEKFPLSLPHQLPTGNKRAQNQLTDQRTSGYFDGLPDYFFLFLRLSLYFF